MCCRRCGRPGRLRWHGSYSRALITLTAVHILPVMRLFCALCRRTFSLLPVFVEKSHRYAKAVIFQALRLLKSRTYEAVAGWLADSSRRCTAVLTLHLWRRKFA